MSWKKPRYESDLLDQRKDSCKDAEKLCSAVRVGMVGRCHGLNGCEFEQAPGGCEDREPWRDAAHGAADSGMT